MPLCNGTRPRKDPGDTNPAFIIIGLPTAKIANPIRALAAVIGRIDDERIFGRIDFLQLGEQPGDSTVGVVDTGGVDCALVVQCAVLGNELIRRPDGVVRFVEPDVQKKRRVGVALFVEPGDCVVDDEMAGIPFELSNGLAVAQVVGGILSWGPDGRAEPVVETMLRWCRLVSVTPGQTEMPFPEMCRGISLALQYLGERDFALE